MSDRRTGKPQEGEWSPTGDSRNGSKPLSRATGYPTPLATRQESVAQICEAFLKAGSESYQKKHSRFLQRLLAQPLAGPKDLRGKEMKKNMGRPRKKEGEISFEDFLRVGIVGSLYDHAREGGQKHSVAVTQAVELIKKRDPTMRISETLVKCILAAWRPRGSHDILLFKVSTLTGDKLAKLYPNEAPISVTKFGMTLGDRPIYPRHNRKPPKV